MTEQLHDALTHFYTNFQTDTSYSILAELAYCDEEREVLFRFGIQKAFESACYLEDTQIVEAIVASPLAGSIFID